MHDIDAIKEQMPIARAWALLQLPGTPKERKGAQKSPFRDERNPSFSIFNEGQNWKDHGTGDGGDVVDFWMKATGKSKGDSIAELAGLCGLANHANDPLPYKRLKSMGPAAQYEPVHVPLLDVEECTYAMQAAIQRGPSRELLHWLDSKRISQTVAFNLAKEGSLGLTPRGQLCFFFKHGTKIRGRLEDSHSCFWEEGSTASHVWRDHRLDDAKVGTVFVTEGESDLMRTAPLILRDRTMTPTIVSMPSASWRPDAAMAHRLGAFRDVVLLMDGDKAGKLCCEALCAILKAEAEGCRIWRPEFPVDSDCCELKDEELLKMFDRMKRID
jgi:DNA primase